MQYFFVDLFWAEINSSFKRYCVQICVHEACVCTSVVRFCVSRVWVHGVSFYVCCPVCSSGMYLCQWQCSDTFLCEYVGNVFTDKSVCVTLCVLWGLLWLRCLWCRFIWMMCVFVVKIKLNTHILCMNSHTHTHMHNQLLWGIVHESSKYKYIMRFIFIVKSVKIHQYILI